MELTTKNKEIGDKYYKQPCHAMYDKTKFQDHLLYMNKCIYHKITSEYLTLMHNLRVDHGQKILLSVHDHAQTSFADILALVDRFTVNCSRVFFTYVANSS